MEAPQSELQSDALQHHRPNRHLTQDDLGNGPRRESGHSLPDLISPASSVARLLGEERTA